jgi:hypothetical protein
VIWPVAGSSSRAVRDSELIPAGERVGSAEHVLVGPGYHNCSSRARALAPQPSLPLPNSRLKAALDFGLFGGMSE